MEVIGVGAAVGIIVAVACMMFYQKGMRDGSGARIRRDCGSGSRKAMTQQAQSGKTISPDGDEAAAMMKRYEAILSYDPYQTAIKAAEEGERI